MRRFESAPIAAPTTMPYWCTGWSPLYRLVAAGTIEEEVMGLKTKKGELVASILDGEGLVDETLTSEELRAQLVD